MVPAKMSESHIWIISRILISREDANIDIAFNARLYIFNQYIFWQNNKILPKDMESVKCGMKMSFAN